MYKKLFAIILAAWVSLALAQNVKVVYHITTGVDTAAAALNNIQNHLNADPTVKIVVVSNAAGIDFMLQDAKDSKGREFSATVATLAGRGVEFRVCNTTLSNRNISPDKLLMEGKVVPSGVAEVILKQEAGWSYLKAGVN